MVQNEKDFWLCSCNHVNNSFKCVKCGNSKEQSIRLVKLCERCHQSLEYVRRYSGVSARKRTDGKVVCGLCPEPSPIDFAISRGMITRHWYGANGRLRWE